MFAELEQEALMSRLKELRSDLFGALSPGMERLGLIARKSQSAFRKRMPFGRASAQLAHIYHGTTDFDVTISVGLRIDAVEDLIHSEYVAPDWLPERKDRRWQKETATIADELGNLIGHSQLRWSVATAGDIAPAAKSIVSTFEAIGVPYIARYSNLEETLAALLNDRFKPVHYVTCMRAVALAFILRKTDILDNLITSSEILLKAKNDIGLPDFQRVAARVRSLLDIP